MPPTPLRSSPPSVPPGANRPVVAGCLGCFGLFLAVMAVALLFLIGSDTGPAALAAGMLLACLPVPVYLSLALWLDRYEPEPPSLLFGAFLWGAVVAVFFSFLLNTLNSLLAHAATGSVEVAHLVGAVVSAPLVEESAKGLALLILFLWKREEFEGVVDGVVYACMVALGFAMTENFQYYGKALAQGGAFELTVTFVLRGILSPFSHPLFTSFTGIGLGLARQSDHPLLKVLAPPSGLGLAVALHALWNGSASVHIGAWLGAYILVMIPAGGVVLGVVVLSLRHESSLLQLHLWPEVQAGRLTQAEYAWLHSISRRLKVAFSVFISQGPAAWLACERYSNLASELSFLRHRTRRGLTSPERSVLLEGQIKQRMALERQRFQWGIV